MPYPKRSRSRGHGRRQPTRWRQDTFDFTNTAAADITVMDITPDPLAGEQPHGTGLCKSLFVTINASQAAGGTSQDDYSIGIAVVTEDAVTAGSVPNPTTDPRQGWYWWATKAFTATAENLMWPIYDFVVKSARLLRGGYRLVAIISNPANAAPIRFTVGIRGLWALNA